MCAKHLMGGLKAKADCLQMNAKKRKCFVCAPTAHYAFVMLLLFLCLFAFICGQTAFACKRRLKDKVSGKKKPR